MQQIGDISHYVSRLSIRRDFERVKFLDELEKPVIKSEAIKTIKNPYKTYKRKKQKLTQLQLQRMRDYRQNNPEKMKELRDKNTEYLKQWKKDNAEKCRQYTKKYKQNFIEKYGIDAWRDRKNNNARKLRERKNDKSSKSA